MRVNPLAIVDPKYTIEDWYRFRSHLLLPPQWMLIILKNFSDFGLATAQLAEINRQYNDHLWNRMKMDSEVTLLQKMYRIAGVPVKYMSESIPIGKLESQKTYNYVQQNVEGFIGGGDTLYFYSGIEENALIAATEVVKKAVRENFKCYMLDMPAFMEEVTTFERSEKLNKLETVDLAVLYFVGSEYARKETGFVSSHLNAFVQKRSVNGKSTILSSSMTPEKFRKRYDMPLTATVLEFMDSNISKTMKELRDKLAKGK